MRCTICGDTKVLLTALDVRGCGVCKADGTANEVPKDLADEATMEDLLARKPGLSVRFGPDPAPTAQPEPPYVPAAQPEPPAEEWPVDDPAAAREAGEEK